MARFLKCLLKGSTIGLPRLQNLSISSLQSFSLANISTNETDRLLIVHWQGGTESEYPFIFLRDNCPCPKCFHPTAKARAINTVASVDLNISPSEVHLKKDSEALICSWPDGHISVFSNTWLYEHRFPLADGGVIRQRNIAKIKWSRSMQGNIPLVGYEQLMNEDRVARLHIENLIIYGISLVKQAPVESEVVNKVGSRIAAGFLKRTHYGDVFTVRSKPDPNNVAYTADTLPLHVDLVFKEYLPGIQMLHCLEQSREEGSGTNQFADGLNATDIIRRNDPEAFDILTKVKFMFNDVGKDTFGEFDFQIERPIIGLDEDNEFRCLRLNNQVRSSYINASARTVQKCYRAYYKLMETVSHRDNMIEYKMKPGDLMCFDNQRVLHGRTGYGHDSSPRWLEGAYLDWDEVFSKYRVLGRKLNIPG